VGHEVCSYWTDGVTNIGAGKIGAAGSKTIKPQTEWRPGVQWRYAGLQNSKMIGHDFSRAGVWAI